MLKSDFDNGSQIWQEMPQKSFGGGTWNASVYGSGITAGAQYMVRAKMLFRKSDNTMYWAISSNSTVTIPL
jgi:hypothetical protein